MEEAPLSLCFWPFWDGWKKLSTDVRPTFHLTPWYLLSKHRTWLINESDWQTQRSMVILLFMEVMYERFPRAASNKKKPQLHFCLCFYVVIKQTQTVQMRRVTAELAFLAARPCPVGRLFGVVSDSHSPDRCSIRMSVSFMGSCPGVVSIQPRATEATGLHLCSLLIPQ